MGLARKIEKFEIILGRIFISLVSVASTFLLLDSISSYFISNRSPVETQFPVQIFRHPQPYIMFKGKPYAEDLNELGYRGSKPLVPKDADEYRVFVLGGSTTFAGNPPIAVLLEEEFKRNGFSNVKVYNFGVISSVSSMELARIVFEISDLEPDLIVMYNGGNDILHPRGWDPRPGYPFNFVVYENNPLLESDIKSYPTLALFIYGSNIFRYLFPVYFTERFIPLNQLRQEVGYDSEEWRDEIAKIYVNNLVKADRVSSAFGAEFIAFFQPLVYFKENLHAQEEQYGVPSDYRNYILDMRYRILSEIDKVNTDSSIEIVDLSGIYEDTSEWVFVDSIHTRQENKIVVVREMYNQIVNNFDLESISN